MELICKNLKEVQSALAEIDQALDHFRTEPYKLDIWLTATDDLEDISELILGTSELILDSYKDSDDDSDDENLTLVSRHIKNFIENRLSLESIYPDMVKELEFQKKSLQKQLIVQTEVEKSIHRDLVKTSRLIIELCLANKNNKSSINSENIDYLKSISNSTPFKEALAEFPDSSIKFLKSKFSLTL